MQAWLKKLLTEIDNETPDLVRVLAVVSLLSGIGLAGYAVYKTGTFSLQDYGIGVGSLFAGLSAALRFKKETPLKEDGQ